MVECDTTADKSQVMPRHRDQTFTCDHATAVDDRPYRLGGGGEQRLFWTGFRLNIFECGGGCVQEVIDNGHNGRVRCREVPRKVSGRYVRGGRDLLDSRGLMPAPDTDVQGGIDKPLAAALRRHGVNLASYLPTSAGLPTGRALILQGDITLTDIA
jgi:hypothetical protein